MRLRRVTTAVDTGIAVNPDTDRGAAAGRPDLRPHRRARTARSRSKNGRVQQSNFNDYRMLRIDQIPPIEVHLIKSGEAPGGIGETGATAGPPALRNALYAATGVALETLAHRPRAAGAGEPA